MSNKNQTRFSTRSIHGGQKPDPTTGAILTPIYQSTTYVQQAVGQDLGYTYSRADNPTVSALEAALGELEGTLPAICLGSGMGAIATLFWAVLQKGDHVVVGDVVYGGTVRLLQEVLTRFGVTTTFVDAAIPRLVAEAIRPETKLIFIETPANPTLKLSDITVIGGLAAKAGIPLAVDNTFQTAACQKPIDLGADIVVYSTTKYIEGHNSTIGGAVLTNDEVLRERLHRVRKTIGTIQAPQEAWLTLRGLKTLPLRMRRHSQNALKVARWLEEQPAVARVWYPGLESFPQAGLALRQHDGHGGMLAFELTGGLGAGTGLLAAVELCSLAENLGAAETLITHPASMTHADVPTQQRRAAGIADGLIRLSVGLEDARDIIADLQAALIQVENTQEAGHA